MPCDNNGCIGGRGFELKGKLFCSPQCLNEYFKLSPYDTDYWATDSDTDSDTDSEC